ncbi:MAG: benzoyl-CoA-dihydrodiol lyase, partial [Myxococcales bacterium]|nr:benzoyl-CoA-dihydrodiol lyase [Myxococcales bacterium]
RLVDKRKVRRDLADVFSTLAEGVRGSRAVSWGLVDAVYPRSKFAEKVGERAKVIADRTPDRDGPGVKLTNLTPDVQEEGEKTTFRFEHVTLVVDAAERTATITMQGPKGEPATTKEALREQGARAWALAAFRELDRALLELRFNRPNIGLVILKTEGDPELVRKHDAALLSLAEGDWFAKETLLNMARVLRRLDLTAKSLFAIIEPGSCFAGSLFELTIAADRSYMLDPDDGDAPQVGLSAINFGALPMSNGISRLATRFLAKPEHVEALRDETDLMDAGAALELGLVTFTPDDIDWEDDVRIAIEERVSLSPDALTGMEANLRFAGPETMETKIFARLSAWQNWIFQRPNAVGERGALTMYGRPERPEYDWRRT